MLNDTFYVAMTLTCENNVFLCLGDSLELKDTLDEAHNRTVRCVAWSPSGNHIASSSFDATTVVWEKQSGKTTVCFAHFDFVRQNKTPSFSNFREVGDFSNSRRTRERSESGQLGAI